VHHEPTTKTTLSRLGLRAGFHVTNTSSITDTQHALKQTYALRRSTLNAQ